MPLSEEELRLLEQMERALVADDPKLASTMRGTTLRASARRRALARRAWSSSVGVVVLMTGAVTQNYHRRHHRLRGHARSRRTSPSAPGAATTRPPSSPAAEPGRTRRFSVIDGGRSAQARGPRAAARRQSQHSMMERFEERWRRRRDQNGY